jgi:flagellar hook-associated protein 3 FlgL
MAIRTPDTTINQNLILELQRNRERIATLQEQIATGKRIVHLGDDPTGSALILDFQTSIDQNAAYLKQADSASSFLSAAETGAQSLSDSITRLLEIGQQGLSSTTGANGRAALSTEVDGIRTNIISTGNTQEQGKYIFAGTATLTQPFSGPAAGPIVYGGDSGLINLGVSSTFSVTTNVPGNTLFLGPGGQGSAGDVFQAVTDLRDGLATNNSALIQTAYNNLQAIQARVTQTTTDLGGRQSALTGIQDTLQNVNLDLQSVLNTNQQLDYPSAITDFSTAQTTQQATLSTLAKANQKNLFDYLG